MFTRVPTSFSTFSRLVSIAVVVSLFVDVAQSASSTEPQRARKAIVLVMPFTNMSSDVAPDLSTSFASIFGETLDDAGIQTKLPPIGLLTINNRLWDYARAQNVDLVAQGTIKKTGGKTEITVNLVLVESMVPVWIHNYESATDGQTEIAWALSADIKRLWQEQLEQ